MAKVFGHHSKSHIVTVIAAVLFKSQDCYDTLVPLNVQCVHGVYMCKVINELFLYRRRV